MVLTIKNTDYYREALDNFKPENYQALTDELKNIMDSYHKVSLKLVDEKTANDRDSWLTKWDQSPKELDALIDKLVLNHPDPKFAKKYGLEMNGKVYKTSADEDFDPDIDTVEFKLDHIGW